MAGWDLFKRIRAAAAAFRHPSGRGCAPSACAGEQRLSALLAAAPAVVFVARWDEFMSASFVSANVLELFGHSSEDFLSDPGFWLSHVHPDDYAGIHSALDTLLERGSGSMEYRFRHKDGRWLWTREETRLVRDAAGQPLEVVGSWIDTTEARAAQQALAASDAQLRATQRLLADALESSDDAFTLFDADDRLVLFNNRYREMYPTIADIIAPGVTLEALLLTSAVRGQYRGVHPEHAEEWVRERLVRHESSNGVFEQRLSDGRVLEIVERRTSEGGRVAIRRDVTKRKHMEEALRRELTFQQTLIDALPFPIFFKGSDGRYLGCNTRFAEVLGLPMERIVGHTLFDIMPAEKAEEYHRADLDILTNPAPVQVYETTMTWADGSIRRLQVVKGKFNDAGGKPAGFIGSLIDLTGQKRAEEQLVQAAKLATLGQIASEVAHELNQPLSIIRMKAEMVLQAQADGSLPATELHRKLSAIFGQVSRMAEIVDHLRAFSRLEDGAKRPFALAPVITAAAKLLSPQYQLDGINLAIEIGAPLAEVEGSPNQLEQVVLNLLANARDAVRQNRPAGQGKVELRLTEEDGWVRLVVHDNGGGVPEPLWPTVFEPFFTTKDVGKGTGLGLSISANILLGMGGTIEGRNLDEGACFTVSLPLFSPAETIAEALPPSIPPFPYCAPAPFPNSPRGRVLVVDDEALAVECIAEFLAHRGFQVFSATAPGPALDLAHKHRIDVLVSDLRMPGMEGSVLLERLRGRYPDLPAVLMTGGPIPTPVAAGVHILRKPLALNELAEQLEALLAEKSCVP